MRHALLLAVALLTTTPGCASTLILTGGPAVFGGTGLDAAIVSAPVTDDLHLVPLPLVPLALIDLPLSFVADVLLLPVCLIGHCTGTGSGRP